MLISMNSLPGCLEAIDIDSDDVSLGRNADNHWCILQRENGKWAVFYRSWTLNSSTPRSPASGFPRGWWRRVFWRE
jgi:hypothetical protein